MAPSIHRQRSRGEPGTAQADGRGLDITTAGGLRVSPDLFVAIGPVANSPGVTIDGRLAPLSGKGPQWPGP